MSALRLFDACGQKRRLTDKKGKYHSFLFWNIVAAVAHLANAAASYWTASETSRENMYPVFQDYSLWKVKDEYCANSTNAIGYVQTGMDDEEFVILPTESAKTSELSLIWLIIGFHLLSFVFQIVLNTDYFRDWYVQNVLKNGVNPLRFVEYSISASLMLICLALISNILSLYALIGLGIMTAATQLFGLLAECLFSDEYLSTSTGYVEQEKVPLFGRASFRDSEIAIATQKPGKPEKLVRKPEKPERRSKRHPLASSVRRLGWIAHFSGWVTMLGGYGGILLNQYAWGLEQNNANGVGPPPWVNALIITIALLYNVFGFLQLFQLCAKDPYLNSVTGGRSTCQCVSNGGSGDGSRIRVCGKSLNEAVELIFVLNSLSTKSVLGWVIIGQLMRAEDVITTTITCS